MKTQLNQQKNQLNKQQVYSKDAENLNYGLKWSSHTVNGINFSLPTYYKPIKIIGQGSFGSVVLCMDERIPSKNKQNLVAIKKMPRIFQFKRGAKRVLRQLKMLRLLKHPNLVKTRSIIPPKSKLQFQDLYIVFEVMESDLFDVVKKSKGKLEESDCQIIIYDILKGLKYIHSADVMHRDIKSKNILFNSNFDVQICDLGMVRPIMDHSKRGILSQYVTTRWYRAPQVLLGQTNYTTAVDVWGVGCILAQILFGQPFLRGQSTKQQLQLISQLMQDEDLEEVRKKNIQLYEILAKKIEKKRKSFIKKSKKLSILAFDLLKKMLQFNPLKRITIKQALDHPFFLFCRQPQTQISRERINPKQFDFENQKLSGSQLKSLIYEEILQSNKQQHKNMTTSITKTQMNETSCSEGQNQPTILYLSFQKQSEEEDQSFIIE